MLNVKESPGSPLISVVIPLYNKERQIAATLASVARQDFDDYEVIVVNDGSTDNGPEVVTRYADSRIRLVSQRNAGVSAARNRGIREAGGRYVAFLDADDEWKSGYLRSQVRLIEKFPECGIFASAYEYKDENGDITPAVYRGIRFPGKAGILDNYFEVASMSAPPLWTSAVVVRKECVTGIGGFKEGVVTGEDLLLWAKLAARFRIAFSRMPNALYNMPSGGTLRKDPHDMTLANDIVRRELIDIYVNIRPARMRLYLSFWDKMRAVINLRKGERVQAFRYACGALGWNPLNGKALALMVLSLMPSKVSNLLIR